jgi:anti-anti-sigma regulatory factor
MPTNITHIEDPERERTILRVSGELTLEDALLLEKIALDLQRETKKILALDLADLHFMDSDSAPVLKRLEREHGFEIEGLEIFRQTIVNAAENKNPR